MTRNWRYLVWMWGLAMGFGAGSVHAAVRLAILSPDDSERARQLVDLAVVETGRLPEVEVLDRGAAWERLQEEQLAQLGWLSGETAIVLGHRLAVDVFALVETATGGQEAIGLVAFDVGTGVRLWDATLPPGQIDEQVAAIVEGLSSAMRKRGALADGVRAISFGAVRNVGLPRTEDSALDGVARMVERRLNSASNLVVLERRRLEWRNEEQAENRSDERERIRGAVVMADVEFMSDPAGREPAMRIQLTGWQGESIGTLELPASLSDMAGVADHMAAGICSLMDGGCLDIVADRRREAGHFAAEARHALGHGQAEVALRAAEAAHALDPADEEIAGVLVTVLFKSAQQILNRQYVLPGRVEDRREERWRALKRAERAAQVVERFLGTWVPPPNLSKKNRHPVINQPMESAYTRLIYDAFRNGTYDDPMLRLPLRELQQKAREMFKEQFQRYAEVVTSDSTFRKLSGWMGHGPFQYSPVCMPTPADLLDDQLWMLEAWLKLAETYQLGNENYGIGIAPLREIQSRTNQFWFIDTYALDGAPGAGWKLGPPEHARLEQLFAGMRIHVNPVIRLYGLRGHLWARNQLAPLAVEELTAGIEAIQEAGYAILVEELARDERALRHMTYRALLFAAGLHPDRSWQVRWEKALFDLMLEMGEVSPEVLAALEGWPGVDGNALGARRAAQQLRARLDANDVISLWGREGFAQTRLWGIEQALQAQTADHPEKHPVLPARPLLGSNTRPGVETLSPPRIEGRNLWVAAWGHKEGTPEGELKILHVDLSTDEVRPVAEANTAAWLGPYAPIELRQPSRGRGFWVVPTGYHGLVILHDDGAPARFVRQADGLPSDQIHSALAVENRLYLGLGASYSEAYMGVYDLDSGRFDILCSSQRKTGTSPLDNVAPAYTIELLEWDAPRQRLLFLVHFSPHHPVGRHPARGLWAFYPDEGTWKLIQGFYSNICRGRRLTDGRLFLDSSLVACLFDTEEDVGHLVYASHEKSAGPGLTPSKAAMALERYSSGPFALRKDEIWSTFPFSRIFADGRQQTYYALSEAIPLPRYQHGNRLDVLEGNALLLAYPGGLWRIDIPPSMGGAGDEGGGGMGKNISRW